MARFITILLLAAAFAAVARADGASVMAGHAYARAECARCHAIREDEMWSPNPKAPPFNQIANASGMTGAALLVILQTPHREMPDLIIPQQEKADLVDYILSLKRETGKH